MTAPRRLRRCRLLALRAAVCLTFRLGSRQCYRRLRDSSRQLLKCLDCLDPGGVRKIHERVIVCPSAFASSEPVDDADETRIQAK
jgi:hypothetical protein